MSGPSFEVHAFEVHAKLARSSPDKAGQLCIGSEFAEDTAAWFCLSGPMLYYFRDDKSAEAMGVICLPGCEANLIDDERETPSFELRAGAWSIVLTAPHTEALLDWAVELSPQVAPDPSLDTATASNQLRSTRIRTFTAAGSAGSTGAAVVEGTKAISLQRFSSVRGFEMTFNLEPGASQSKILKEMKRVARAEARTQDVSSSFDKLFDFEVSWRKLKLIEEEDERRKEMNIEPTAKMGYHVLDPEEFADDVQSSDTAFIDVDSKVNEAQILALLNDSPKFHTRLNQLDAYMSQLNTSFTKIDKSAHTFLDAGRQAINTAAALAQDVASFSDALTCFHDDGEDPDSEHDQGLNVWVNSWSTLLREMQILKTVLDTLLQSGFREPLHELFRVETKEAQEAKKSFDSARAKYSVALQRYLAMKKDTKQEVIQREEEKLSVLKNSVVELARVAMARLLSVERRRKLEYLERLNDFMYLHQSYFRHGWKMMQVYEKPMRQLRAAIQDSHRERVKLGNSYVAKFEELRAQVETHHTTDVNSVTAAEGSDVSKEGYLLLRDFKNTLLNPARRDWKRRFFVCEDGKFFYRRTAQNEAKTKGELNLMLATVRLPKTDKRFTFEIVSKQPEVTYLLQAENEQDKNEWIHAIQSTTANLLGISMPGGHGMADGDVAMLPGMTVMDLAEGNKVCADCPTANPEWASINLGITLCLQCSGVHRSLGVHITKVRSLAMDEWGDARLAFMKQSGNSLFNRVYEDKSKISPEDEAKRDPKSRANLEQFIRMKYIEKRFVRDRPDTPLTCDAFVAACGAPPAGAGADVAGEGGGGAQAGGAEAEAEAARIETLLYLLAKDGSNLIKQARAADGRTGLHQAILAGNPGIVEMLVQNGAPMNAQDLDGNTPLHLAATSAQRECVALLIEHKPDITALNSAGQTAGQLAAAKGNMDIAALCGHEESEEPSAESPAQGGVGGWIKRKTSRKASSVGAGAGASAPPPPPPPPTATTQKAVALFAYEAQRPDELNLVEGDTVEVTKKDASGWWEGILNGRKGLFPGNYVEVAK